MGQACCVSNDKINQFTPEIKDATLADWKEHLKLLLHYNNSYAVIINNIVYLRVC